MSESVCVRVRVRARVCVCALCGCVRVCVSYLVYNCLDFYMSRTI